MTGSKPAALPLGYIPAMYLLIATFVAFEMVRVKRLELSHLAILEPKSSASTNSAKPAYIKSFKENSTLFFKILNNIISTI